MEIFKNWEVKLTITLPFTPQQWWWSGQILQLILWSSTRSLCFFKKWNIHYTKHTYLRNPMANIVEPGRVLGKVSHTLTPFTFFPWHLLTVQTEYQADRPLLSYCYWCSYVPIMRQAFSGFTFWSVLKCHIVKRYFCKVLWKQLLLL